jgi:hypothetical protein
MTRELFFAAALLSAPMAFAQAPCGPVEEVLKALEANVGEVPTAMGKDERGFAAMLTVSPSGSFTVLGLRPDGVACFLTTGDGWRSTTAKSADKGA